MLNRFIFFINDCSFYFVDFLNCFLCCFQFFCYCFLLTIVYSKLCLCLFINFSRYFNYIFNILFLFQNVFLRYILRETFIFICLLNFLLKGLFLFLLASIEHSKRIWSWSRPFLWFCGILSAYILSHHPCLRSSKINRHLLFKILKIR